jgi:peptidoglycan-associated lipoprotein
VSCKRQDIKSNNDAQDNTIETIAFSDEPSIRIETENEEELKTVYFAFDKSELTRVSLETLKENAAYLMRNHTFNVVVEGHTDNRGTIEYNLSLGQRRALKVKEYCVQLGILPNRIATISYGKEKPVDHENNEVAWSRNRRAATKVLKSKK